MKTSKTFLLTLLLSVATVLLPLLASCTGAAKIEDYYGKLQAVDGAELVLTLNGGTTARIKMEDAKAISKAQGLVGAQVRAKVRNLKLSEIQPLGENGHLNGIIESISGDSVVISGRTLKITPDTMLDGGLAPGIMARSEFIKASDGSLLAIEIETVRESMKLTGVITSMNANTIVVGDKTCKVDSAARLENGLATGVQARARFIAVPDGSMVASPAESNGGIVYQWSPGLTLVAVAIEREQGDDRFTGKLDAIYPDALVIGGKVVRINAATRFEQGLSVGALVRIRFIKMSDGSLLATRVEVEKRRVELDWEQEAQSLEEQVRAREQQFQSLVVQVQARDQELRRRQLELEQFEQELRRSEDGAGRRAEEQKLKRRIVEGDGVGGQGASTDAGGASGGDTTAGGGTTTGGGTGGTGTDAGGAIPPGTGTDTGGTPPGAGTDTGGTTPGAGTDTVGTTGGTSGGGSGSDPGPGGGTSGGPGGGGGGGGSGSDPGTGGGTSGGSGGGGGSDDSGGSGGKGSDDDSSGSSSSSGGSGGGGNP
ncbi:MAG: hypothetical protein HYX79_01595 [Chloroflexi bacterium]|nr:hypothetical protein [Chloroflexota bacterium]